MTNLGEIYQSEFSGVTVKVIQAGSGVLICDGVEMNRLDKWFPEAVPAVPEKQ